MNDGSESQTTCCIGRRVEQKGRRLSFRRRDSFDKLAIFFTSHSLRQLHRRARYTFEEAVEDSAELIALKVMTRAFGKTITDCSFATGKFSSS